MLFSLHCSVFGLYFVWRCVFNILLDFFSTSYLNVIKRVIFNLADTVKLLKGHFTQTLLPLVISSHADNLVFCAQFFKISALRFLPPPQRKITFLKFDNICYSVDYPGNR